MDKGHIITRVFPVLRGATTMEYPLQTFSAVLTKEWDGWDLTSDQTALLDYIRQVFLYGYPERSGKDSISSLPPFMHKKWRLRQDHWVLQEAKNSRYVGEAQLQHAVFQGHVMRNSPKIVACEVPVFDEEWHGHIDNIYFDGDAIIIADLKPGALKEKYAVCQLVRYADLLIKNLSIDPASIHLLYHDDQHCFTSSYSAI